MSGLDQRRHMALAHWAVENLQNAKAVQPEDWPVASRFPSDGALPVFCGEYAPGLTGLYAILNGLKLLVAHIAPLKPFDEQMLLEVGCNFMRGREAISPQRGLRSHLVIRLADAMVFALVRRRGDWMESQPVQGHGTHTLSFHALFERAILAKRVVLISLGGGHYSVLRGYTADSWLLFDATGRQWILRRRSGEEVMLRPILVLARRS